MLPKTKQCGVIKLPDNLHEYKASEEEQVYRTIDTLHRDISTLYDSYKKWKRKYTGLFDRAEQYFTVTRFYEKLLSNLKDSKKGMKKVYDGAREAERKRVRKLEYSKNRVQVLNLRIEGLLMDFRRWKEKVIPDDSDKLNERMGEYMYREFSRQPRFLPEMPKGEIEIPNPPNAYDKPEISWFALLAPPGVMLVITVLIAMSSQSLFLLISISATVVTLIVSLTNAASQIKKYNKKKKEREQKYFQFITDTRSELALAKEQQIKAVREMNPEPSACIQRLLRIDEKLWERTSSFNDFLSLRIGVGYANHAIRIKYTKQAVTMENDPLLMEPQRLAHEFEKISDIPVTIHLLESEICGIAGESEKTTELIKLMLLQLVTHHGYDDVRIVLLVHQESLKHWNWMRYLPHIWNDDYNTRYLLCGKALAHQALSELNHLFRERDLKKESGGTLPHYVFVVEDVALLDNEPISKYLYNCSARIGVSSIFAAKNPAYLPMNCRTVIRLQGKSGEIADRITGEDDIFIPDASNYQNLEVAARKLSSLRIKNASKDFVLPPMITLLDMLRVKNVTEIDVGTLWDKNRTYMGMNVPVGARVGGVPFSLDMHETGHGPHGLVAGTTGSGKSELLQTLIISLAIHYHPHDVVFVLIDYKGGGMADVFQGMPHLVGTITNLDGNQTTRALLSIKSELFRRQRIFSKFNVNNIDKYQKLYYSSQNNTNMPPVPHLIMIADEFAELKQDQPDFMKELVSTARVGRSLGVHLILATQKPAGVVDDQIWSNSKFKICLKVQDEADSRDVIKRPDASMIKEPGRAYIQVGNDEIFELFQSAYSGADYDPEGEKQKKENKPKRVYSLSLHGKAEQIYPMQEEKIIKNELPSQLKAVVEYIKESMENEGIQQLKGPWLPPLPEYIYLDPFFTTKGITTGSKPEILSTPVGILDNPREQIQKPFIIDFVKDGNLFVYGAPGTGKTTFLKTLCISLAHRYTPNEVNLYIMDFGGTSLKGFSLLPHCGGVITLEQENRIHQFMLFLFRKMEQRKKLFEQEGYENFYACKTAGKKLPGIIVIIDNYFALSETYETVDEQMIVLAREGVKFGIYFVATATNAGFIRYKLSVNFKMAVSFQLIEKSEYNGIVGRTEGMEPADYPGRGLVREKPPLEFQAALPEFSDLSIEQIIQAFRSKEENRAEKIPEMPSRIHINEIQDRDGHLGIGLGDYDLQPVYLDFYTSPVMMVAGEPMSGKSTVVSAWISMLKDAEIYVFDSFGMGLYSIINLPHVKKASYSDEVFIQTMEELLENRKKQLVDCKMTGGDVNGLVHGWKQVIVVIDRLSELIDEGSDSLKELLERIVKRERGLKVAIIAADNTSGLSDNWDSLAKAVREEQTGILIGSIREQPLYSAKIPYGSPEKEMEQGDGYLIIKNKLTSLRFAG